jgi:predicted secreted protein
MGSLHPPARFLSRLSKRAVKAMQLLVEADDGRTVDVRQGETVRVTLQENATTGYRWGDRSRR